MLARWRQDKFTLGLLALSFAFVLLSLGVYYNKTRAEGAYLEVNTVVEDNLKIVNRAKGTDLDVLRRQLEQTRSDLEATTFPSPQKARDVSGLFARWVQDSGVQLKSLSSTRGEEKLVQGAYPTYYYQLRITGSLSQIQSFLGRFDTDGPVTLVVTKALSELKENTWEATINSTLYTQRE